MYPKKVPHVSRQTIVQNHFFFPPRNSYSKRARPCVRKLVVLQLCTQGGEFPHDPTMAIENWGYAMRKTAIEMAFVPTNNVLLVKKIEGPVWYTI